MNERPVAGGALVTTGQDVVTSITPATPDRPDDAAAPHVTRAEFVARLLELGRRHGEIPIYGSPEWEQLPADDPRRFAAVVVAAELWRQDGEPDRMARRLRDELEVADLLARGRIRALSWDLAAAEDWSAIAAWTPIAELQRLRRYEPEQA